MRGLHLLWIILFPVSCFNAQQTFEKPIESTAISRNSFVIRNTDYLDVNNGVFVSDKDILVRNGLITKIGEQLDTEDSIKEIDGSGKYLVPGLIDAHIHLFQSGGLYTRPDALDLSAINPYEEEIEWLKNHSSDILTSYMRLGITTVVDVGGPMHNYKIRKDARLRDDQPNLFLTGPLISTYQPEAFAISDPPIIKVNTEEEAREMVRRQLPFHPDFIKIWYIALPSLSAASTYDIVAAAVQESHLHGLQVAIHATQLNTAKLAIRAGADVLVHSVSDPVDDEFIDMLLKNQVKYIPTLMVHGNYDLAFADMLNLDDEHLSIVHPHIIGSLLDVRHINHPNLEQAQKFAIPMLEQNGRSDKIRKTNLKKIIDAGVVVATGTDAGNIGTLHGVSYFDELRAMEDAGLTNAEIIKASTLGAAHVIGQEDHLGSIEIGKRADLLMLHANPLDDLEELRNILHLFKSGVVIDGNALLHETPEDLAQKQLNAYNLGLLDAFLEPYSESVKVYNFPDQLMYTGKDKMRSHYKTFFDQQSERLHCRLVKRIVQGNTVIDQEHVTGLVNGQEIYAIAIYKIREGKIAEVYFDLGR